MRELILEHSKNLKSGRIIDRLNRFTLIVKMNSSQERVYLANPGALSTVIGEGKEILCEPAEGKNRKTNYNAFAIKTGEIYVTVNSVFANSLFFEILKKGLLSELKDYSKISREPSLPNHGRADFLLENKEENQSAYVEVKSCTHVEDGIAKFPDRPTKRGRRHLRSLASLLDDNTMSYLIFMIQRPDAEKFKAFREVDPEFANLLREVNEGGVKVKAISTEFVPPKIYLKKKEVPVVLSH
ncbi:MAG: DNA/RNA nuclease SfsA [Hadesarchaea archaeon]|nr:DNA/RNA nuclease SfsA [Hadesarchaea archaeon]